MQYPDPKFEVERLVALVAKERQRKTFAAVYSLWRIGDGVRRLRKVVAPGAWRRTLELSAHRVGAHASSLDDAARAAEAFDANERTELRERFARAGAELTASHVVQLARVSPQQRARGIEALLRKRYTVQELRSFLRRQSPSP